MNKKIIRLKRNKKISTFLLICLVAGVIGLTGILLNGNNNIRVDKLVSKVKSLNNLNANVIDAEGEVTLASSYDEITYSFNITKANDDEAIITGTLTDTESKYARFKENTNADVSDNGKKIILKTTSSHPKIVLIISNAPYGEVINPQFTINSETNSNITVEPVKVLSNSIEGTVKDENGNTLGGLELSLSNSSKEIKRTYSDSDGKYVFNLGEDDNYIVKLEEEKYKVVREEEKTTNENKRILDIIVKETIPFEVEINKTIKKVDLIVNGKKESYDYNNLNKVVRSVKNSKSLEGSIYYNISIKNIGNETGTLTVLKDILHDGLSFDESKNPGWVKKDNDLLIEYSSNKKIISREYIII